LPVGFLHLNESRSRAKSCNSNQTKEIVVAQNFNILLLNSQKGLLFPNFVFFGRKVFDKKKI